MDALQFEICSKYILCQCINKQIFDSFNEETVFLPTDIESAVEPTWTAECNLDRYNGNPEN